MEGSDMLNTICLAHISLALTGQYLSIDWSIPQHRLVDILALTGQCKNGRNPKVRSL